MTLKISPALSLPKDAVIYGGKGMGKTNLASVLVEEFAGAVLRFAVIDPMGVWWGLRHGADGKGAGVKVLILGGIHGDFPIEPTSGAMVADLVVDDDESVIIDISRRPDGSMWSIAERVRFVTAFAKRLYQRQGEKRRPINLVVDEAARFAPQVVRHGDTEAAACIGAIAVIVEEGRNVGIGVTLVTQRSARLNKDVAELADCMIAFRTVGPNSMRAVLDWLGEHIEKARFKELGEKLRELPRGSALVVSPGWLEFEGIVAMRKRRTFDSSKTPEAGKEVRASGPGAKPDLDKYSTRMADLVDRAKLDDPKHLRARIAELEKSNKDLRTTNDTLGRHAAEQETRARAIVETPIISEAVLNRLDLRLKEATTLRERTDIMIGQLGDASSDVATALVEIKDALERHSRPVVHRDIKSANVSGKGGSSHGAAGPVRSAATRTPVIAAEGVTGPQQRILNALAVLDRIGVSPADKTQLALVAAASPTSSSYANNLGALRTAGLIDYPGPGTIALTVEGIAVADASAAPSTVGEMHAFVRELVTAPQWRLLEVLIEFHPKAVDKEYLASSAGASATSSSYANNLGSLRSLGLIDYPQRGTVKAEPVLFLEGR